MADLFTGPPLVGWRCWKVGPEAKVLRSLYMAYDWPTDEAEATHLPGMGNPFAYVPPSKVEPHEAPASKHPCGLHGYARLEDVQAREQHGSSHAYAYVYGAFVAWGRIFIHKQGFRTAKAKVLCLVEQDDPKLVVALSTSVKTITAEGWLKRVQKVADAYGVPLLPADLAVSYVADEGVSLDEFQVPAGD